MNESFKISNSDSVGVKFKIPKSMREIKRIQPGRIMNIIILVFIWFWIVCNCIFETAILPWKSCWTFYLRSLTLSLVFGTLNIYSSCDNFLNRWKKLLRSKMRVRLFMCSNNFLKIIEMCDDYQRPLIWSESAGARGLKSLKWYLCNTSVK